MKTARHIAVEALLRVDRDGGYSNLVLDGGLKTGGLDERDRAFCSALFYGVLERRLTLDAVIAHYARQPMKRIAPAVLELLRAALYQLLYMDGVPSSAAVNESVELSKTMGCGHASGFLNGVLRAFLRDGGVLGGVLPDRAADTAGYLSVCYSAPRWLCELWLADYGEAAAEAVLAAALGRPPLFLRVNTRRTTAQALVEQFCGVGAQARAVPEVPGCITVEGAGAVEALPGFAEGLFIVQDVSSQLAAAALDARPGQRVADFCAAPGGKAFTAAQWMDDTGELCAYDLHAQKVRLIEKGAARLGLTCIHAGENDAKLYNEALGEFDRVLCDAPCSGLGVIRRKPEIRYKEPQGLAGLPEIQYNILETSSKYIAKGGRLVYSTCTLRRAENDEVAERFLREHPEFAPAPLPKWLQALVQPDEPWRATLLPGGALRADGFFLACFARA